MSPIQTRHRRTLLARRLAAIALVAPAAFSTVQAQDARPLAQYWIDAATSSMSIPGMDQAGGGMMGAMMGGMAGGARGGGGAPGRSLDLSLYARNKPGAAGTHAIPPPLKLGESLPLLAVKPAGRTQGRDTDEQYERPKGRILLYWGCGAQVRAGQPRVVDFSKSSPEEYGKFMSGRSAPDRGARHTPGHAVWPNERDKQQVPRDASLIGSHAVSGESVPASLKFAVAAGNDFLGAIRMTAAGNPKEAVTAGWNAIDNAGAYFLTAMGSKRGGDTADMVMWSSSVVAEPGWGLMDYLPPSLVTRYLGENVLLPPATTQCVIPSGIFAETEGAMVRMIAYGPELNLAHPPRPARAGAPWNPEWAVRVRTKSTGMTMLGAEEQRGGRAGSGRSGQPAAESGADKESEGKQEMPKPLDLLRGIFGR